MTDFPPSRAAALDRLRAFAPQAGENYAARRNYDTGRHEAVSRLSPYLRHRVITEAEVFAAVLAHHDAESAGKFLQEVAWRSYWKGWLERRPSVWSDYTAARSAAWNRVQTESGLRRRWEEACKGETGIDAFDHWAAELTGTGYLHNHARMWFASIWIFTLNLPWALGADFFLRHLLDGDAASNTLSWRWVAGRQTKGKAYVARADNIARYTEGRFAPTGLADAPQIDAGDPHPPLQHCPAPDTPATDLKTGLLMTEDDLTADLGLADLPHLSAAAIQLAPDARSHLSVAPHVTGFVAALADDAATRLTQAIAPPARVSDVDQIVAWARAEHLRQVVCAHVPVGPNGDALAGLDAALADHGIRLVKMMRDWDQLAWPHATHGFFRFRSVIPTLAKAAGGVRQTA